MKNRPTTPTAIQVDKDGVIDYPLYSGQTLDGIWNVVPNPNGPSVTPDDGFLHYFVNNQRGFNEWLFVSIMTPIETAKGALLLFRVRANTIQSNEVKFTLASDVILRFMGWGSSVNWQYWEGSSFHTLAASSIRADATWHDIVMAFSPGAVSLFEDGKYMFTWQKSVGAQVSPRFDMQVWSQEANLSFDVGAIYSVPSTFAPGISTPWDYSFRANTSPPAEAMSFQVASGGPQVTFGDGYVRFAALPLSAQNSWSSLDMRQTAPATSVFSYPVRVNKSGGSETKVTLPGDNILRLLNNGASSYWMSWDGSFHTLAQSGILAGQEDFTIVTLVTNGSSISLLENGVFKFQRNYSAVAQWNPSLSVQHLDVGTDVSVDIGGIRVLPCIKPPSLLAIDLQDEMLAYFSLKGTAENAAQNSGDLVALGGTPAYTPGPFGLAANFSGGKVVFEFPRLGTVTSQSYTLSVWVKVNNYPPAGQLTGIAGALLLDSDGRLNFSFLYNRENVYQEQVFKSRNVLAKNVWHNIVVTYSYEESRLGIFVDGNIDSIVYIGGDVASASAIVPAAYYVGGYKAGVDQSLIVLDGAVSDLMLMTQHVHQPSVNMLANVEPVMQPHALAIPLIIPAFFLLLAAVTRVGIEYDYLEQKSPEPPPTLDQVAQSIVRQVGAPARPNARVSRADLGINSSYPILLDIGGEGPLNVYGLVTGFQDAINLNAVLSGQGTPKVSIPGPFEGATIPHLVQLQAWDTDPEYPFVDGFADRITMIGAPLTQTNVREIARVIRDGGEIDLWINYKLYPQAVQELATLLHSVVEEPGEIPAFAGNGVPDTQSEEGTWFVRRRIIAHKNG